MSILRPIIALTLLSGTAAWAQEPVAQNAPAGTVYRLSPDEIAKIDPNPRAGDPKLAYDPLFDRSLFDNPNAAPRDRRPHGEVGAFVGSGGASGVFGSTTVPIGENGSASFSFENSDYGRRRSRWR